MDKREHHAYDTHPHAQTASHPNSMIQNTRMSPRLRFSKLHQPSKRERKNPDAQPEAFFFQSIYSTLDGTQDNLIIEMEV